MSERRFAMRIVGVAGGYGPTPHDGRWLIESDPDADDGRGRLTTTNDLRLAATWEHASFALEEWRRISKAKPWRDDGHPNRPLTAYTVAVEPVDVPKPT